MKEMANRILLLCILSLNIFSSARAEYVAENIELIQLTNDGKTRALSWAPHGDTIACIREETNTLRQLMIIDADGSNTEFISLVGNPIFAEWSWKGDKIAFEFTNTADSESQGAIYIYDKNLKQTTCISPPYKEKDLDPDDGPFFSADDRYVAYKARIGPSRTRRVWVYDTTTNKSWQLLPERGQAQEQRWSSSLPNKLCLQFETSESWDVATVNPDGSDLVQITDIGVQSIETEHPRWSPAGNWIAFIFDKDMTRTERDRHISDCFIARPDGSQIRNLTMSTSPVTEKQVRLGNILWSWDGRWILSEGDRFDAQGNDIQTLYLIDPQQSKCEILRTSKPREGTIEFFMSLKWSYDSSKIVILSRRYTVRNWGPDAQFEKQQTALSLLDINTRVLTDLLVLDEQQDRKTLLGNYDRDSGIEDICWSPDNRSLILTIAKIISQADEIYRPDVYRLDLGEEFISKEASENIGPTTGRSINLLQTPIEVKKTPPKQATVPQDVKQQENTFDVITETIHPLHMTVDEAIESLPATYSQYFTKNNSRNLLLFKGPPEVLAEFRSDLERIDTLPPQILVDLLAIELTDEANRSLGLDWTYAKGRIAFFQPVGKSISALTPDTVFDGIETFAGAGQIFYQGVGKLPREFFISLNTLVQEGKGTILANPRTVAMSGKESMIQIRKTLNYFFNEGFDVSGRPIVKKSDISADTQGRIIPTLLADGRINLVVDVKVGSFTFTPDGGLPEQINRESTTEVTVQEGETLIIGGLRQQEMSQVTSKIPVLGDLPILGNLFKKEENEIRHSVLTLFITPHVLSEQQPNLEWPKIDIEDVNSASITDILKNMKIE